MLTTIEFPKSLTKSQGLQSIPLRDLDSVVVLAGPNGSGKSRFLRLVPQVIKRARQGALDVATLNAAIDSAGKARVRASHQAEHDSRRRQLDANLVKARAESNLVTADPTLAARPCISLNTDGTLEVQDPGALTVRELAAASAFKMSATSLPQLYGRLHAFLDGVAATLWNERHPDSGSEKNLQLDAEEALAFNGLLYDLLGERVHYKIVEKRPRATLFGRVVEPKELSAGQKLLVMWSMYLSINRVSRLGGCVLLVDEPENHLHPSACVRVLENLARAVGPHGQLWIATHSPTVIASFNTRSLYLARSGKLEYAGRHVTKMMEGLLGDAAARQRLSAFLGDSGSGRVPAIRGRVSNVTSRCRAHDQR